MASKYGIKIKNIKAATLYEYNLGLRDYYSYTNAMFTNNLLSYYLQDNGLRVSKDNRTRDIICLEFDFGTKSYGEAVKNLEDAINKIKDKPEEQERRIRLENLLERLHLNREQFVKMTADELRLEYYTKGVDVPYIITNKKGEVVKTELIHYRMLYRSSGKAKEGSCMFIADRLYKKARNFIYMGIDMPKNDAPIVEASAYVSLITSSIIDTLNIHPDNILVLKDVDSTFNREVISVEIDDKRQCYSTRIKDYELSNTLFDGQALIDNSIFPEWGNGYVLLRNHMCKMAAFKSNIQLFFQDYFGKNYETATVIDMFGVEHKAKDIKLITTDNAMKWLKFGVSYDYWADKVKANGCKFGIVKTAHKSKLGEVQRMSYQMINALDMDIMENVTQLSREYINDLKNDTEVFMQFLRDNATFVNDYDVLVALCEYNPEFVRSEYFRTRRKHIINAYIKKMQTGKVLQEGDNLVIVGSPYAMLLHTVGESVEKDDTFKTEPCGIQCYTRRFKEGEYLTGFRSPFNSRNNLTPLHNVYDDRLDRYFDITEQVIAVNLQHTDFQDRNNGSDQDSDSIYCTNQPDIAACAKRCYRDYPTVVNNIPKEKKKYKYSLANYAHIDNNLAAAQLAIGEASNLAQLALTYTNNFDDEKYENYACILAVLAQVAIDNAKRTYDIDLTNEIKRIKRNMDIKKNGYPRFWLNIRKGFPKDKINYDLKCPMNYLGDIKFKRAIVQSETLPMSYFYKQHELKTSRRQSRKVEGFIEKYSYELYGGLVNTKEPDYFLLQDGFDALIEDIKKIYISKEYVGLYSWLINRAFSITQGVQSKANIMSVKTMNNKSLLLKVLYNINPDNLLKIFSKNLEK